MEKIYKTYQPPKNPFLIPLAVMFLLLIILPLGTIFIHIDPISSIVFLMVDIVLMAFFLYKYYAYTRAWVKENVKCPFCGKSISKVSGYGGGKHSRANGFILHCGNCNNDSALAVGPAGWVLQDVNPSAMIALRIGFLLEEMIGFFALFVMFCVLLGILLLFLFVETTFHINMFNPSQEPVQESNLTLAKENLCRQAGGGVLTQMCCSQVKIDDFPNTCVVDVEKVCACSLFSQTTPVRYCYCGSGKCWDTNNNGCVTAPKMPSNQSH